MTSTATPRICVVGAGIAGLSAAWELQRSAPSAAVVVLEATPRAGGVIRTSQFAGRATDEGPDAFLGRVEDGTRLCAELGLTPDLTAPATGRAFVYLDGALVPLPPAQFLGVPLDPGDVDAGLLSAGALAALADDLARPAARSVRRGGDDRPAPAIAAIATGDVPAAALGADRSIAGLIRQRLGNEVLERLVAPLVGAINAGDCDQLSLHAAAPALAEAAASDTSLIRALRERGAGGAAGPAFWGLRGGMERLTAALAERLSPALALAEPALGVAMRPGGDGRQVVSGVRTPERSIDCDAVVLAVGAQPAARLVAPWAPQAAALLAATETASVAIVTLAYEAAAVPGVAAGSGFVVPAAAGLPITACSWASVKWAHLGASSEAPTAILRVSLGRHGDDALVTEADEALVAAARSGLAATMGIAAVPSETRVSRYLDAFPQYAVGHLQRTAAVEGELRTAGVFCAGSSYHGIGIPACIAGGRRAARSALAHARDRTRS